MGMNHEQQRFAEEYLMGVEATRAAIRAGTTPARLLIRGME
jgi:phage terminase small subunit